MWWFICMHVNVWPWELSTCTSWRMIAAQVLAMRAREWFAICLKVLWLSGFSCVILLCFQVFEISCFQAFRFACVCLGLSGFQVFRFSGLHVFDWDFQVFRFSGLQVFVRRFQAFRCFKFSGLNVFVCVFRFSGFPVWRCCFWRFQVFKLSGLWVFKFTFVCLGVLAFSSGFQVCIIVFGYVLKFSGFQVFRFACVCLGFSGFQVCVQVFRFCQCFNFSGFSLLHGFEGCSLHVKCVGLHKLIGLATKALYSEMALVLWQAERCELGMPMH